MSKTNNPLCPLTSTSALIDTKSGELKRTRYRAGFPKVYAVNLSGMGGTFGVLGADQLTKKGESFSLVPLAYNYFKGSLFGQPEKLWMEVFFVNELGWVCQLMFSAHNAENLINTFTDAEIYRDLQLGEFILNVRLDTRSINLPDGNRATYFVCGFQFEEITTDEKETWRSIFDSIAAPIYRSDIADPNFKSIETQNWNLQPEPTESVEQFIENQQRQKQLPDAKPIAA